MRGAYIEVRADSRNIHRRNVFARKRYRVVITTRPSLPEEPRGGNYRTLQTSGARRGKVRFSRIFFTNVVVCACRVLRQNRVDEQACTRGNVGRTITELGVLIAALTAVATTYASPAFRTRVAQHHRSRTRPRFWKLKKQKLYVSLSYDLLP